MDKEMKIAAELDEDGLCYEFNTFRIVVNESGRLFYGTDSGCSCPSPFENFKSEADWTPLDQVPDSVDSFKRALSSWASDAKVSASTRDEFEHRILSILALPNEGAR